ncbi:MAG: hypothetical protein HQK89_16870 [Nitrospirae bacterium]|nr:hypothetical protein [Nitrospirota bacterium]
MSGIGSISSGVAQAAALKSASAGKNTKAEEANESAAEKRSEGDTVSISKEAKEAAGQ